MLVMTALILVLLFWIFRRNLVDMSSSGHNEYYVQRVNGLSLYSSVGIRFVLLLISESIIGHMVTREKLHKGRLG